MDARILFVGGAEWVCVWTVFPYSAPIRETLERNTFSTSFIILSSQLSSVYSHTDKQSPLYDPCTHSRNTYQCTQEINEACH